MKKLIVAFLTMFSVQVVMAGIIYMPRVPGLDGVLDIMPYFSYDRSNYRVNSSTSMNITGDLTVTIGYLHIGTGGTVNYADGDGDVYIKDELEVDGKSRLGTIYCTSGNYNYNGIDLYTWPVLSFDGATRFKSSLSRDQFVLTLHLNHGLQIIIGDSKGFNKDFDHAVQTDPTIFLHSSQDPNIDNTQWFSMSYSSDSDRAEFDTGGGEFYFKKPMTIIGDVGIGTGTVTAQLHIVSNSSPSEYIVKVSSQNGDILFSITGNGNVSVSSGVFKVEGTDDPIVIFDQNTIGGAIVDFQGTEEKDGTGTIDTGGTGYSSNTTDVAAPNAASWSVAKMIKIKVNGVDMWIPAYNSGGH